MINIEEIFYQSKKYIECMSIFILWRNMKEIYEICLTNKFDINNRVRGFLLKLIMIILNFNLIFERW
jgi:hypothetical protein